MLLAGLERETGSEREDSTVFVDSAVVVAGGFTGSRFEGRLSVGLLVGTETESALEVGIRPDTLDRSVVFVSLDRVDFFGDSRGDTEVSEEESDSESELEEFEV